MNVDRRAWMGLLARAPIDLLERWAQSLKLPRYTWLRRPETGLAMVRARIGGTGAKFNLGELTITRCVLRLEGGVCGIAYVQGRSTRKAELAALADALMQNADTAPSVKAALLDPLHAHLDAESMRQKRKVQATRVEFFTLAREAGG